MKRVVLVALLLLGTPAFSYAGSQTYASPGAYTFTIPTHSSLTVQVWGAGGGGATAGKVGTDGGASSFGGLVDAHGGLKSVANTPGTGGSGYGGSTNYTGGTGTLGNDNTMIVLFGGDGGAGAMGGAGGTGARPVNTGTEVAQPGTFPGGGGGGSVYAAGAGGGGYSSHTWSAGSLTPGNTVSVTVGSPGTGAYVSANRSGGAGAAGQVVISWVDAAPSTPTGLAYSCNAAGDSASFSWNATPGALYYWPRIYTISASTCNAFGWQLWTTDNATCYPNPDNWSANSVSNFPISPNTAYTFYVMSVSAGGNSSSAQVNFSCPSPAPTCSVWSDTTQLQHGQSTYLRWSSSNASTFYIANVGYVSGSGSATIAPTTQTSYNGTVTGPGGTGTCNFTQYVSPPSPALVYLSCNIAGDRATIYWSTSTGATSYNPRISAIGASNCTSMGWQLWTDNTTCIPNPDTWNATIVHNIPISPNTAYDFWVHAYSGSGGWSTQSDLEFSCPPVPPTCSLTRSPASIAQGQSATLTWSSQNSTSCTGSGFNTGGAGAGSVSVSPTQTTTYGASCSGPGGSTTCSPATVTVTCSQTYTCTGPDGQTITRRNTDCSTTDITTCVLPQFCSAGLPTCQINTITGSLTAMPKLVRINDTATITWSTTHAVSCSLSGNGVAMAGTSGTYVTPPITQSVTYRLSCDDADSDSVADDFVRTVDVTLAPNYQEI